MIVWTAGHNMPGYLPEGDVVTFETRKAALDYMVYELDNAASYCIEISDEVGADEYVAAATSLREHDADVDGDWYDTFEDGRIAYWFTAQDVTDDEAAEMLNGED